MLADLFSGDDERAAAAAQRVTPADLPGLLAALRGSDPEQRWWAVCALAHLPDSEATTALMGVAADTDADVRAVAVYSLGGRAAPEVITPLLFALDDASDYI